jgi:hypothetical protein
MNGPDEIQHLSEMCDLLKEKRRFFMSRYNVTAIIGKLTTLIEFIEHQIRCECKHEYVEDYIDIDPEKSVRISYCKLCYCSFPTN